MRCGEGADGLCLLLRGEHSDGTVTGFAPVAAAWLGRALVIEAENDVALARDEAQRDVNGAEAIGDCLVGGLAVDVGEDRIFSCGIEMGRLDEKCADAQALADGRGSELDRGVQRGDFGGEFWILSKGADRAAICKPREGVARSSVGVAE